MPYAASFVAPAGARHRTRQVAVTVGAGASPFEVAVACEVFGMARPELGFDPYRLELCGVGGPDVELAGFGVRLARGLEGLVGADTVVVPHAPHGEGRCPPELTAALRAAHERGARLVSFCSGAFALAEAGLLDGRPAATHWLFAAELARRFPAVDVHDDVLYVDDGDVLTSAGTAAAIDLSLHLVRLDHGAAVANSIARRMVVPPHRDGGQAQFITGPAAGPTTPGAPGAGGPDAPGDAATSTRAVASTMDWMVAHLDRPLTVEAMARHAHLSPRTFARRFVEICGATPVRWLTAQRVQQARELLETTDLPIEAVATSCGFGTATNLRQHFGRACGVTPSAYRNTFRAGR